MSVQLTGTYGYFTRQGAVIGEYNRVAALYGSALTAGAQTIWVQYATSDQQAVNGLWDAVSQYRTSGQTYQGVLQADGQQTTLLQVDRDVSVVPYTVQQALTLLIAQMEAASASVQKPTVSASVTPWASNLGDATVVVGTTDVYGNQLDMVFAEDIVCTCNTVPSVTSYEAALDAVGEAAADPVTYLWPAGSGASTSFTIKDGAVDGIVSYGGFPTWTGSGSNTPTGWTIIDGDAGVTVFKSAGGGVRSGTDAAKILSDGSQPTQLAQNVTLEPNTVYCVAVYAKINSLDATGEFVMKLTDGDGNTLQDDAGNDLSYTRNVNGQVSTSYALFTAFFSTPRQLPTTVQVSYGFSTAATAAKFLTIDLAAVVAAQQLYAGGPYAAAFAGSSRTSQGDYYTITVSNSAGSNTFVRGMDRLYSLRTNGLALPSASSPTISDSLVTH